MIEVKAQRQPWNNRIDLLVLDRTSTQTRIGANIVMRTIEEGEYMTPTLTLGDTEAQALMDELWNCGLRPSEGTGSAGSLAATERHLKDMQSIALGLLRKDGMQV